MSDVPIRWLESLDYRLVFRDAGWSECLATRGAERWLGRGATEAEAISDLLRQMLPSHAGQSLLATALPGAWTGDVESASSAVSEVVEADPLGAMGGTLGDSAGGSENREETISDGEDGSETDNPACPPALPQARVIQIPTIVAEADTVVDIPSPLRLPWPRPAQVRAPTPRRGTELTTELPVVATMDAAAAAADVAIIVELIEAKQPELALMTPERQRLAILAWICHARSLEEASGRHPTVQQRVSEVARRLSRLCKEWWPGSVKPLQIEARPRDVARELELGPGRHLRRWAEAAEAAEERLCFVESRDEQDGRDEYGWSDKAFLDPPPVDADALLVEIRNTIEGLTGSLNQTPGAVPLAVRQADSALRERLVALVGQTRWLRGFVADFEGWGTVMGRLRWMIAGMERRDSALQQLLSPGFRPRHSWAAQLGQDPEQKRKQRQRRALLRRRPQPHTQPNQEQLIAWMVEAFLVLEAERIARLLIPFQATIHALTADKLPAANRAQRRRLRKVQEHLASLTDADYEAALADLNAEVAEASAAQPETPRPDPHAFVLAAVVPLTRGKRALFVSNRADPDLQKTLETAFDFEELEWCSGDPRRVQTVAERVSSGRFDLVMGATGFQSHSMDTHLIRACRRASIPYVRVHRGRRLATALALAREFGVSL